MPASKPDKQAHRCKWNPQAEAEQQEDRNTGFEVMPDKWSNVKFYSSVAEGHNE